MRGRRLVGWMVWALALGACEAENNAAGGDADAAPNVDGSIRPDGATPDAAPPTPDGATPDAAPPTPDGATPDAAAPDAAPPDAAPPDGALPDAAPGDAAPGDAAPGDAAPGDAAPGDAALPDASPDDATVADAVPPDADVPDPDAGPACAEDDTRACPDDPCGGGVQTCVAGEWSACAWPEETCNGADDDCDGALDEDANGDLLAEACYGGVAGTAGVGECRAGVRTCIDGGFGACVGEVVPGAETCDGLDNDCNGVEDDAPGVGEACEAGTGACLRAGSRACDPFTGELACDAIPGDPAAETCDAADEDCDGATDDVEGVGEACTSGAGICAREGVLACGESGPPTCDAVPGDPEDETCDGEDDDCDGEVDDVAGVGDACSAGTGACARDGVLGCDANGEVTCDAVAGDPTDETCNGADDDCNGTDDDVAGLGDACEVGVGACRREATLVCGATPEPVCDATPGDPIDETCNGEDDDCDGEIDDVPGIGDACAVGVGACEREGVIACVDGAEPACDAVEGEPTEEVCNGEDDDCDGEIDEVEGPCTVGRGACLQNGTRLCVEGAEVCTDLGPEADPEVCAGEGCDGVVRSGLVFDECGVCGGDDQSCAPGSPLEIAGLALWLKADRLFAGGGPRAVDQWADLSGRNNHALQATADRRPQYVQNAIAGHGAVRFAGTHRLDLTQHLFAAANFPRTVFVVLKTEDASAHVFGAGETSANNLTAYGTGLAINAGFPFAKAVSNNSGTQLQATVGIADQAPHVVSAVIANADSSIFVDGQPAGRAFGSISAPYTRTSIGAATGSTAVGLTEPFVGDIAEIVVYDGALAAPARTAIEAHLAAQYGIERRGPRGCDGVLGSGRVVDACGRCDGDGSDCGADAVTAVAPALWLRADDLVGLHAGQRVDVWTDASGGNAHARQTRPALAPTFVPGGPGERPVVRFDGDDRLDLDVNVFSSAGFPRTVFVVLATEDDRGHVIGTGSGSANNIDTYGGGLVLLGGAPLLKAINNSSGVRLAAESVVNDGERHVVSAVARAGGSAIFVDGQPAGEHFGNTNAYNYARASIGAANGDNNNTLTEPFIGDVAEIIVYPGALDTLQRTAIEQYLARKYAAPRVGPRGCDGEPDSGAASDVCGECGGAGDDCGADVFDDFRPALWLRAHDLSTLAPGQLVNRWIDAAGRGIEARQSTPARSPRFVADGLGGKPVLRFDGDDRLDLSANLFARGVVPRSLFIVMKTEDQRAHVVGTGSGSANQTTTYGAGFALEGGQVWVKSDSNSSGVKVAGELVVADNTPRLVSAVMTDARSSVWIDGRLEGMGTGAQNAYQYSVSSIGAGNGDNNNALGEPFTGDIAEIIAFAEPLDDETRLRVEAYLAGKYGLERQGPVDCEGTLGGEAVLDACGECGGDGTACTGDAVEALQPRMWLRADELFGLRDGQRVQIWPGDGVDAFQTALTRAPILRRASFGEHAGVEFTGQERLDLTAHLFAAANHPKTVFAVLRTEDTAGHIVGAGSTSANDLVTDGSGLVINGGNAVLKANTNNGGTRIDGTRPVTGDVPRIVTGVFSDSEGRSRVGVDCRTAGRGGAAPRVPAYVKSTLGAADGPNNNSFVDPLIGTIAEVLVFDRILTDADRGAVELYLGLKYGLQACTPGVGEPADTLRDATAFWRLDETGNAPRVEVSGGPSLTVFPADANLPATPGVVGDGALFNGGGAYLRLQQGGSVNHYGDSFTWAGWFRFDEVGADRTLFGKWNRDGASRREYLLRLRGGSSQIEWMVSDNGGDGPGHYAQLTHPQRIAAGAFYFVEVWHDAVNDRLGIRVSTRQVRGQAVTLPWANGIFTGAEELNVGAHFGGTRERLIGVVDALGLWIRILSDAESQFLWNAGNGWEPPLPPAEPPAEQ